MRFLLFISLFIFFSCSESIKLSKGEEIFIDQLLDKKFLSGTHVIFILNQSFCAPCEEEVKKFYSQKFNNCIKSFIIPSNRKPTLDESKNYMEFNYNDLAKYGLIRVNGTVIIIKNGSCTLLESIDIAHIEPLTKQIKSVLKK